MDRVRLIAGSHRLLLLAALALISLALGSAVFSGARFSSKSSNSASLGAASVQLGTSHSNQIVSATGMRPGDSRQGSIAVENKGDVAGKVTLAATGLTGTALAAAIELKVEDTTGGGATQKWSGKLGSFGTLDLGSIATGASRSYRLTLSWPAAANEAALQGASTSLTFRWSGSS